MFLFQPNILMFLWYIYTLERVEAIFLSFQFIIQLSLDHEKPLEISFVNSLHCLSLLFFSLPCNRSVFNRTVTIYVVKIIA